MALSREVDQKVRTQDTNSCIDMIQTSRWEAPLTVLVYYFLKYKPGQIDSSVIPFKNVFSESSLSQYISYK